MQKQTGFVILFINIVNFVVKHQRDANLVVLVKDMDIRILREDRDELLGLGIILYSYTENVRTCVIKVELYTLLIYKSNFNVELSSFSRQSSLYLYQSSWLNLTCELLPHSLERKMERRLNLDGVGILIIDYVSYEC